MQRDNTKKDGAIIHCRVSSSKQAQEGESLDVQGSICLKIAAGREWELKHEPWLESISSSGNKKRPDFQEILDFLDTHPGEVQHYIFRSIDRFTRSGSVTYGNMKQELARRGVAMEDSNGIIQPTKNTLDYLGIGISYDWSMQSPSEISEVVMATTAKGEITTILTRLIGQEIELARQGYVVRAPQDGYVTKKVLVEGKKKTIAVPDPDRAKYYAAMFEMRALGQYTDREIVERINAMGYRTKQFNRWDKKHQKIIGQSGSRPLTIKHLQVIIKNAAYCAVIIEKWTKNLPIRAQYPGLVSIETFNQANRGKVHIKDMGDAGLEVLYNYSPNQIIQRKLKDNPLYPYKFILCPKCGKPFLGSAPRGKSGQKFPAYHCSRSHSWYSVNKKTFDTTVENYVNSLEFQPEPLDGLYEVLIDRYRERQAEIIKVASEVGLNVVDLELQKAQATQAYIAANSPTVRESIEAEIEKMGKQIKTAQAERNKLEITEQDIDSFIKDAKEVMEHPSEMLLNPTNIQQQRLLFGLVFEETPTYEQIVNGTPKLTWIFRLSKQSEEHKSELVTAAGIEPAT